jgi:hypothetical protein
MSPPNPRRIFVDSLPIAAILLFWVVISWLGTHPLLGRSARIAGLVMALTYAIVWGITSASHTRSPPEFAGLGSVLRVNGHALLAGVGWFVVARLVLFAEQLWNELAFPGAFTSPAEGLAFAFTATGVVTIVLYAVTLATSILRDQSAPKQESMDLDGTPADD